MLPKLSVSAVIAVNCMRLRSPLIIALALSLAGCTPSVTTGQLSIAASTYPLAFVVEQLQESESSLTLITPPGAEPHEFEPTPNQIASALGADLFLYNGGGLDPWAERLTPDRDTSNQATLMALSLIDPLEGSEDEGHGDDPHFWLDPQRMQRLSVAVAKSLVAIDPAHQAEYQQRAQAFASALSALDREYRQGLAACELHDIIVAHDAFRYLGDRYGLTVHALAGLSPEDERPVSNLVEIAALAKQKQIRAVFVEGEQQGQAAESFAADLRGSVLVLNPIESLTVEQGAAGEDYFSIMRKNLSALRQGLRCR